MTKNGQSAAKPLHLKRHEERSETISKESRVQLPETVGLFNAKFYTLSDPDTDEIRYIGRTIQSLSTRLTKHVSEAKKNCLKGNGNLRENWIMSLLKACRRPNIQLIKTVENKSALQIYNIEKELILSYKSEGYRLVNSNDHAILLDLGTENHKKVYQYHIDTKKFIREFNSAGHAMRETSIYDACIGRACKGKGGYGCKSAGGYLWSYNKYEEYPFSSERKDSSKAIFMFKNGIFIKEYKNARIAAFELNISYKGISHSCIHDKLYKGLKFEFK